VSDRPSWMPSDEEIERAFLDTEADWHYTIEPVRRLIERTALKAQVNALEDVIRWEETWPTPYKDFANPARERIVPVDDILKVAAHLRARLTELEEK